MLNDSPTLPAPPAGDGAELRKWGPFQLFERVGSGGFGEVYRGFDHTLQREIAIKLLREDRQHADGSQEAALLREARAMARVVHPNIVPIYGVNTYDGRAGFWSAFVRGKTLFTLVNENGVFGAQETVLIGLDLCRALSAVHGAGLLHRDIKTGNVMREEGGRIVLMDFGLSETQGTRSDYGGTPAYMAPELRAGKRATVRTDIYALGVLLYNLLAGKHPQKEHWSLLEARPDLPPALVGVVHKAIDGDPEKRFGSVAEMAAALADAAGISVNAPLPSQPIKSPTRWIVVAVLAVVAVGSIGYAWRTQRFDLAAPAGAQQEYAKARDLVEHYYRPKALETAIPQLQAITKRSPEFAAAFADLGRANFLQFRQYRNTTYEDPARAASLKAISLDPNIASPHVTLGMLYAQLDKNDLAAQELDTAFRLDRLNAEVWAARAELYIRQGRTDEVEPALRKAMDLSPSDWRWPNQLSDFYYRTGKLDQAISVVNDVVRLSPDNARAWNNLGLYLSSAGRYSEAEKALQKAIQLEPGYNRYTNLGRIELALGNLSQAEAMLMQAIALNANDYRAWDDLGEVYARRDPNATKTLETYRTAIRLAESLRQTKPREVFLLLDLGSLYANIGDAEHAIPLLRQGMALAPESNEAPFQAGASFEKLHRRGDALQLIEVALQKGFPLAVVESSYDLADLRRDPKFIALAKRLR